jgi:hypothetical protein
LTSKRRGKIKYRKTKKEKQTYESSNSNISGSGSLVAAASPDVSFLMEVLEEAHRRFFGIISILAFVSLGSFRTSRCKISLDWHLLGKMRKRNQNLMILQKNVCRKRYQ